MTTSQADDSHNTSDERDGRRRVQSNGKRPWMPFWYLDWKSDPCLAKCCMAAQGLWLRMCIDMFIDDESGEIKGTVKMLARSYGISTAEFAEWVSELAESGTANVFRMANDGKPVLLCGKTGWQIDGKTDGIIIHNRRMLKAFSISMIRSESGKKGAEKRWQSDSKPHGKSEWQNDGNPLSLHSNSNSISETGSGSKKGKGHTPSRQDSKKKLEGVPAATWIDRDLGGVKSAGAAVSIIAASERVDTAQAAEAFKSAVKNGVDALLNGEEAPLDL